MTTRIMPKKLFQQVLQTLRGQGIMVNRTNDRVGYYVMEGDREVLRAMQGSQGYLVRYDQAFLDRHVVFTTA